MQRRIAYITYLKEEEVSLEEIQKMVPEPVIQVIKDSNEEMIILCIEGYISDGIKHITVSDMTEVMDALTDYCVYVQKDIKDAIYDFQYDKISFDEMLKEAERW